MASPAVVLTVETGTSTDASSHTQAISTFGSGTLAIAILAVDGNPTISSSGSVFTEFGTRDDHGGNFVISFWYRVLDGGESSTVWNFGASEKAASIVYEISGAEDPGTQAPEVTTFQSTSAATSIDPPSISGTGGSKDYLFIAGGVQDGEELDDDTWANSSPLNYTPSPPLQRTSGTGGAAGTNVSLLAASRQLTNAGDDPGNFSCDVSHDYLSFTIAVHPASTGNATATPSTVAATVSVPTATKLATALTAVSVVAAAAAIGTPTLRSDQTVTPATIAVSAAVQAPTVRGTAITQPATTAVTVDVPAPTILTGGANATATPSTVAVSASVPASSVLAAAITAPATVAATSSVPASTLQAAGKSTPATVAVAASIPASTVQGSAITQPGVVTVGATVPAPTILVGGNATAQPSTVAALASVPAPSVLATARATPATVAAIATVPVPQLRSDRVTAPATIAISASVAAPTIRGTAVVQGLTITGIVGIPPPSVFGGAVGGPVDDPQAVLPGTEGKAITQGIEGLAQLVEV